jgi:hypothetical protein
MEDLEGRGFSPAGELRKAKGLGPCCLVFRASLRMRLFASWFIPRSRVSQPALHASCKLA